MGSDILSQEQIDELMNCLDVNSNSADKTVKIQKYDFKHPKVLNEEEIRCFEKGIFDWIKQKNKIAKVGNIRVEKYPLVEQCTYEEYIRSIPIYSCHLITNVEVEDHIGFVDFEMNPKFARYYLEKNSGKKLNSKTNFEIDFKQEKILFNLQKKIIKSVPAFCRSKGIKVKFRKSEFYQNSRSAPIINWNEMVLCCRIEIILNETENEKQIVHFNYVIPGELLRSIKRKIRNGKIEKSTAEKIDIQNKIVEFYETPQPLQMTVGELRKMKKGTVLNFNTKTKILKQK